MSRRNLLRALEIVQESMYSNRHFIIPGGGRPVFKRFIGSRAFYHSVLILLIPIVVQQFISNFVSLLDNIMVGSLGTEAISAASIANSVLMVLMLALF